MISIAPLRAVVGATAARGRVVLEGRVVDDGIGARGVDDRVVEDEIERCVDDGAAGAEAALAPAACGAWTTLRLRIGSVEGSVLDLAGSLEGTGATVGAAAAVAVGAGAETGAVMRCAGVTVGVMMRSANA
jgi:hypothetical protein